MAGGPAAFKDLDCISEPTQEVITSLGFTQTTPVQEAVIPLFCGNKDVAVDACTGSGKTLAFVIPLIEKLRRLEEPLKKHQVGAIVVSPTRELSRQIHTVAQPFVASVPGLTSLLLVGGTDPAADVAAFKEAGGHVIVGTPGRIDDVMKRCTIMDFKRLEVFVLDEADRLLDMGFRVQLDSIMAKLPKQRRTGLFSATQTEAVAALARAGLRNPVRVNVAVTAARNTAANNGANASRAANGSNSVQGPGDAAQSDAAEGSQKTPTGLHISYTQCEVDQKMNQLVYFLQQHGTTQKIIVYCLTCACVDFYALALRQLSQPFLKGIEVQALHGRMKQSAREAMLEAFTKSPAGVLLATDLAARGLDIPEVNWVIQMDPPQDPAAFVHRVGRTARAGRAGAALVYLAPHEHTYVDFLKLRKVPMTPREACLDASDVLPSLRKAAETDREVMEAGMKAFVSYIRGYKEHHCKYIFRVQDLPIGRLATSFALLRLPHMPEVKKVLKRTEGGTKVAGLPTCDHFTPSEVNPDTVAFKDKAREKQRQKTLQQRASKEQQTSQKQQANAKEADNKKAAPAHESGARLTAARRRKLQARDELEELDTEYKLLKKLKRGKLSQHEFDVATGLSSDDELDQSMAVDNKQNGARLKGSQQAGTTGSDSEIDVDSEDESQAQKPPKKKLTQPAPRKVRGKDKPKNIPGLVNKGPSRVQQNLDAKKKRKKRRMQQQQQES